MRHPNPVSIHISVVRRRYFGALMRVLFIAAWLRLISTERAARWLVRFGMTFPWKLV